MKSGDGKKKALVVAISKYNDDLLDDLDFCENDGHAMYEVLNDAGYEILENNKIIGNVSKKALENSIVEFFRKNVNPSDTLLFYFTGHGYTDEHGDGFFCTSDIDIKVPDLNGVFFSNLTKQMDKTDSQRIIAILDCCHSGSTLQSDIGRVMGPTEKEAKAIKDGRASLEKEFVHGQGRCILASSLSNKSSYGMEGQPYSAFTYYILEGLKQNKETVDEEGHVTPEKLSMYVSEQLKKLQGENYQKPVRHISFTGKLVIAEYNNLKQKTSSALTDKQVDELLQTDDINEMKKQLRILLGKQQEILEKTPEKSDGNQVLDEKFQELKMKKEVLREKLEKLGETPEVNVRYSLQEAELQLQLGNIPEANKLLNDVLKVNSHDENAKAFKEQIYDEIKRKAKAKDKKTWKLCEFPSFGSPVRSYSPSHRDKVSSPKL